MHMCESMCLCRCVQVCVMCEFMCLCVPAWIFVSVKLCVYVGKCGHAAYVYICKDHAY